MNVVLIGRGRMGAEVERALERGGHAVSERVGGATDTLVRSLRAADVGIDFSVADAVDAHVDAALEAGTPLVVGTTGWSDRLETLRARVEEGGGALLYGANFSVGAFVFRRVVTAAAELFGRVGGYDPYVWEHHHAGKADAPSGTALQLARTLVDRTPSKTRTWIASGAGPVPTDGLSVASVRAGHEPGTHCVGFSGPVDGVELVHRARGRQGFAAGAVMAAEWIQGRTGVFSFEQMMEEVLADD